MNMDFSNVFDDKGTSEFCEFRDLIHRLYDGIFSRGRFRKAESIQRSNVYRLSWEVDNSIRTLVVKRFSRNGSDIERRVLTRWLVDANMAHIAPALLGVVPEPDGSHVWHIYEDLGNAGLDQEKAAAGEKPVKDRGFLSPLQDRLDHDHIEVVIRLISAVHDHFQESAQLGEYRQQSVDLGRCFLSGSVLDAIGTLESFSDGNLIVSQRYRSIRDHLLEQLCSLRTQLTWRAELLEQTDGTHTLLHGDLSVKNAFVLHTENGLRGRLIDWDHAGVGPVSYDLSTFLMQLPIEDRLWTLDLYTDVRTEKMMTRPSLNEWNLLFETHEYARLANSIIWPARAAAEGQPAWAFDELEMIGRWFDGLSPVLLTTDKLNKNGIRDVLSG